MSRDSVWIGFDDREALAFSVARSSIRTYLPNHIHISGVVLNDLIARGWYKRVTETRKLENGVETLWDVISDAPMSTQFAISRFFILKLCEVTHGKAGSGWAMFVDCDVLALDHLDSLFHLAEQQQDKAMLCVHHQHTVVEGSTKKEGQIAVNYGRKNWSSVMLLNRGHPSNKKLTLELLNTVPGRDLHRFCWLDDSEIGSLDVCWNHLAGVEGSQSPNPRIVHFTNGGPWLPQYANIEYADEWRAAFKSWVR